eukprot:Em0001g727a
MAEGVRMSCQLCRNPSFATWTSRLAVDGITSTTGSVACALSRSTSSSAKLWRLHGRHALPVPLQDPEQRDGDGRWYYTTTELLLALYRYDEELVVPIIENTPEEMDLAGSTVEALQAYPDTCAVLVRRQGYLFRIGYEHEACLDQLPQICENHLY